MIELLENEEATKMVTDFLASNDLPETAGFGTQAIIKGFRGTITSIGLVKAIGVRVPVRTAFQGPQMINGKQVAAVGERSVTLSLIFDGGKRSVAISTLKQHEGSNLAGKAFSDMVGTDWAGLVGKTIKCQDAKRDYDQMIPRPKPGATDGATEDRPATKYTFTLEAAPAATPAA